jgi:hypothetical protein
MYSWQSNIAIWWAFSLGVLVLLWELYRLVYNWCFKRLNGHKYCSNRWNSSKNCQNTYNLEDQSNRPKAIDLKWQHKLFKCPDDIHYWRLQSMVKECHQIAQIVCEESGEHSLSGVHCRNSIVVFTDIPLYILSSSPYAPWAETSLLDKVPLYAIRTSPFQHTIDV